MGSLNVMVANDIMLHVLVIRSSYKQALQREDLTQVMQVTQTFGDLSKQGTPQSAPSKKNQKIFL